jgi:nitrous oxide reductase accessory protein NosL
MSESTVFAKGGNGGIGPVNPTTDGLGGDATLGFGNARFSGGNGAAGTALGGGGGYGAGSVEGGTPASGATGGIATTGGGNGGDGGDGSDGSAGLLPGGAGGGSAGRNNLGGAGANGQVILTWTVSNDPTITLGTFPEVCEGITSANLPFSATTNSPNQYSIDYVDDVSLTDVVLQPLGTPPGNIPLDITGVTPGVYDAFLTVTNSGTSATSAPYPFTVTVNALPSAPGTGPVTYCEGDTASPLTATGTNLLWYTTPTGGTGSATAPTPSTASAGTTTYYVSQTVNNCEGPRASLVVTVNTLPSAPGTSPVTYCEGDTASALTATGTNLLWYTVPTGGTGSATAPTPSTASAGTTTYYVSQTVNNCEGPRASLLVTVNALPSAPGTSPVTYCEGDTASALTATGTNLLWYTTPTGGTGSATAPTPSTVSAGTATYYVSQTVNNCEGPRASLIVTVNAPPSEAVAGNNKTISVSSTTLEALPPGIGTGSWSVVSGPSTNLSQFDDTASNNAIFTPDGGNGDYVLRWTISNDPCLPSTDDVTITVNVIGNNAPIVSVPATQNVCEGSTLTLGNPPSIADADNDTQSVTITITNGTLDLVNSGATISGDGTSNVTITNDANATLTNINAAFNGAVFTPAASGPATIQIDTDDGKTGTDSKTFNVDVDALPSAPTGSASQSFCSADNPTVADLTASGTSIQWYDASSGGSLLPGGTTLASGNHYYATQTVSGCESDTRFDVTVTISDPPSVADAGPDQNIAVDTATMEGEPPTTGTGLWNLISGSGTPTSPTSPTSVITGLSNGANVFRWTISNPPCNDYWSEVTITTTYTPSNPPTITLTEFNLHCNDEQSQSIFNHL